jgi:hypothetical protein
VYLFSQALDLIQGRGEILGPEPEGDGLGPIWGTGPVVDPGQIGRRTGLESCPGIEDSLDVSPQFCRGFGPTEILSSFVVPDLGPEPQIHPAPERVGANLEEEIRLYLQAWGPRRREQVEAGQGDLPGLGREVEGRPGQVVGLQLGVYVQTELGGRVGWGLEAPELAPGPSAWAQDVVLDLGRGQDHEDRRIFLTLA